MRIHANVSLKRLVVVCLLAAVADETSGQTCLVNEAQRIEAPAPATSLNEFGNAVAVDGDFALVAARNNDQFGSNAGTVYALRRTAGTWTITQTIGSPDASSGDTFGRSLAIDGMLAVIGAPQEDPGAVNNCGAVYAYEFDGANWVFHSRLIPADVVANKLFGEAVDLDGDRAVIAAPGDMEGGVGLAGAAYVFRFNGAAWAMEQKLLEDTPGPQHWVGKDVAIDGDTIIVTMMPPGNNPAITEAALVFEYDGVSWTQTQRLHSPVWPAFEQFGNAVALDGDTFVVGSPQSGLTGGPRGAAHAFTYDGNNWSFTQTLLPPAPIFNNTGDRFGASVDVRGECMVVGSPSRDVPTYPQDVPSWDAGAGHLLRRGRGGWSMDHILRAEPFWVNSSFTFNNDQDFVGTSVAVSSDTALMGAITTMGNASQFGYATFHALQPPDCDLNGTPDFCDPDCNLDSVVDACEINAEPGIDCDNNGQPDVCQSPAEYVSHNPFPLALWGSFGGDSFDMIWLNQFNVTAGAQRITHLAMPWTLFTAQGLPFTALIYDDPDNDGDPSDAVLLSSSSAVTPYPAAGLAVAFTDVRVPTTLVGDIGDSFFVGIAMSLPPNTGAAVQSSLDNSPVRSWRASTLAPVNIVTPTANMGFAADNYRLMLRAKGLDCNGNGVWDDCDIDAGASLDLNNNGIPDECDAPCPADINGSSAVDVDDLLAVINAWGACPNPRNCPADIAPPGGNDSVNVDDLLAVINAWGKCP